MTYRIETLTGRGLPTNVDVAGYDTRGAAEGMADACHDGEYRVVAESEMEREGQALTMAHGILEYGAEYVAGETREMDWKEADGTKYRGSVRIDAELIAKAEHIAAQLREGR